MGHYVTIEGSLTPTDWLARGVRRTVAVTDEVRKLVRIGGAVVVVGSLDEPTPEVPSDELPQTDTITPDLELPLTETAKTSDDQRPDSDPEPATKRVRAGRKTSPADQDEPQTEPSGES